MTTSTSSQERIEALRARLPKNLKSLNGAVCPACQSTKTIRLGYDRTKQKSGYLCPKCKNHFLVSLVLLGKADG